MRQLTFLLRFFACKRAIFSVIIIFLASAMVSAQTKTIYMAGDSTMSIKDPKDYPETGWGVPFATFFDAQTRTVNLAKNGRSTKTFISEGLWQQIEDNFSEGDYLIIQFGHNDQSQSKKDRYTAPEQYTANLQMMIDSAKSKSVNVILMTPISRRHFSDNGQLKWTHPYAKLVREMANKNPDISFIDMETITHNYIVALGESASALRFMHIAPNLHPNYPFGVRDNTHLNQLGAREVAQLVLSQLKSMQHPLVQRLRAVDPKHLKLKY